MINLSSDYWQVALNEADHEKAVFECHMRLYQFRVMPYWLGIFQQLMSIVLSKIEVCAMAYLDDILVFSETPEEHFNHLR